MDSPDASPFPPVSLPRSEVRDLVSRSGREYRVFVARPAGPPPPGGFPVLYLLDANATFATVVEAIRLRAPRPEVTGVVPTVVVGIGYPVEGPYDRVRRTLDFTPPGSAEPGTGGADDFLAFLTRELAPEVERSTGADPARRILFGHSLGGFFVLRTLFTAPGAFRGYVAASPSTWWDARALEDAGRIRDRLARSPDELRVMIGVGEYEQSLAPWEVGVPGSERTEARRRTRAMVDGARAVAQRLSALDHPRLRVHFECFPGEEHASAVLRTIGRSLRFVLGA